MTGSVPTTQGETTSALQGLSLTMKRIFSSVQLHSTFYFWSGPIDTVLPHNFSNFRAVYVSL